MKRLAVLLALVMTVGLVGCGNSGTQSKTESKSDTKEEATTEEAFEGEYIVNADYVKENLDDIILVDARGEDAANKETIKGAIPIAWQYLATCEDGKSGDANWGCILDTERLSERLGEKGLDPNKEIVLFAAAQNGWGDDGRIAWELIAAGYKDVKMVDGGFDALKEAGIETAKGGSEPKAVDVINTDELKANYDDYKVVDVRADEEYDGETLYGEAKGGHLPGAIHIRYTDLFQKSGMLKSNAEITKMFEDAGITKDDKVVTYCTAGIRSGYMQLILEMCGFKNTQNYDESYYRWCAVEDVEKYIRSFGPYAVAVSFFLMVFQSVAAPLPAFLITFANAAIWGWWRGAILSWSSAMAGAILCFMIARIAGRDVVEKLTTKFAMDSIEQYFERYGKHTILICRLLPFVSFDFVSYAAGLTSMSMAAFLIATGIGQLPATIVYSYVGGMLTGSVKMVVTALLLIFALSVFVALAKKIYTDKHSK